MATQTNIDKIKAFNATRDGTAVPDATTQNTTVTTPRVRTNKDIIAEKAEKTPQELEDEREAALLAERERQQDIINSITDATANLVDRTQRTVNPVRDWIASQPTPGGIAVLLLFIAFMALAAIPVNSQGQTRLYLFWQSLLGRTHMKYREDLPIGGNPNVGGFAGGTFGTPTNTGDTSMNGQSTSAGVDLTHLNLFPTYG